jgi:hypothetical protein
MGAQWYCDQCGGPLKNDEAVPMAIGHPRPEPMMMINPMGQSVKVQLGPGGMPQPYQEDPNHIFEMFQLCRSCGFSLAILFKKKAKAIRYVPIVNDNPLDA